MLQMIGVGEGALATFNITADSTTFQKWEQDALVREHAQYLQATAATSAPPPALPIPAAADIGEWLDFQSLWGTTHFCSGQECT